MLLRTIIFISCVLFVHAIHTQNLTKMYFSGSSITTTVENAKLIEILSTPIGAINGKMFFRDTTLRNWANSKNYCVSIGMKQAYFSTVAESAFVKQKAPAGNYWTSATNIPELSDFHWETSAASVPPHPFDKGAFSTVNALYLETSTNPSSLVVSATSTSLIPLCFMATS